jgi:hypothetical protein
MRKVWVQMSMLPSELMDFLTIWAVGTILRVSKDVDMIFTRQYNRARMQVLVLDPSLIPSSVDVVIGDYVYELHFKVESDEMRENSKPLEMEDDSDDIDGMEDDIASKDNQGDFMQEDGDGNSKGKSVDMRLNNSHTDQHGGSKKAMLKKAPTHGIDEVMQLEYSVDGMLEELSPGARSDDEHFEIFEGDSPELEPVCKNLDIGSPDARSVAAQQETGAGVTPTHILVNNDDRFVVVQQENVEGEAPVHDPTTKVAEVQREIAAIPEASTPSSKSKRRTQSVDEHSLDRAKRIKAARNLDFNSVKGNSSTIESSFIHFSNDNVKKNLQSIGISLGDSSDQISLSIERIKELETE